MADLKARKQAIRTATEHVAKGSVWLRSSAESTRHTADSRKDDRLSSQSARRAKK